MTHPMDPLVLEHDDPTARGEAQGEAWRDPIHELAGIRTELSLQRGSFADEQQVLDVARLHLPVLERTDAGLYAELMGIARAAGLDPASVVVLNHYTDLRDISPAVLDRADPGGCTTLYVRGENGPVLGQTWDMHASAERFVRMLRIKPRSSDTEVVCFTLTGCLGMTGMNERGVAVAINNLTSTDAQVGLVWPALVRRMLAQPTAAVARDILMDTRLSSGHHYMIADERDFFGVETSGQLKVLTQSGAKATHVHTNHCFDPVLRKHERVPGTSTTFQRLNLASTLIAQIGPHDAEGVWTLLTSHEGHPRSICSHVDDATGDPSSSKTCGVVVMDLTARTVLTVQGCSHDHERLPLRLERGRS